mmetsp:Transcript_36851/g.77649  ORF Transcript_36851/g.77649 Transcript_36851/m.77649 type:complete len:318 (+) Transcript_36851:94-1047(+)
MRHLDLYFDGCLRGKGGGAGAVLLSDGDVLWQGSRYLQRVPSSVASEYEALIFGLQAAQEFKPYQLHVYGDCRLVAEQMNGSSSVRKMGKFHKRAQDLSLSFPAEAIVQHIPRSENVMADSLARAAVDAVEALYTSSCMALAEDACLDRAFRVLCDAQNKGVLLSRDVYAGLIFKCEEAHEMDLLIALFAEADASRAGVDRELILAVLRAFEAKGQRSGKLIADLKRRSRRAESPRRQLPSTGRTGPFLRGVEATNRWSWSEFSDPAIQPWCAEVCRRVGSMSATGTASQARADLLQRVARELTTLNGIGILLNDLA